MRPRDVLTAGTLAELLRTIPGDTLVAIENHNDGTFFPLKCASMVKVLDEGKEMWPYVKVLADEDDEPVDICVLYN